MNLVRTAREAVNNQDDELATLVIAASWDSKLLDKLSKDDLPALAAEIKTLSSTIPNDMKNKDWSLVSKALERIAWRLAGALNDVKMGQKALGSLKTKSKIGLND